VITREKALAYHREGRPGKLMITPTKPTGTQEDLSLAYTPGVAEPCREIAKDPETAFEYTAKGNLVAVISNGTAVLGLGNIGALAGKPVMEGKAVLFKRFADIDVFDLELDTEDTDELVRTVEILAPTFGGINLEDIRGPECFEIEERLIESLDIPVFHDDQHGTALISGAALINALEITGKKIDEVQVVFSGAGAAGIGCARFYRDLGVPLENMLLLDSQGVIYEGRTAAINPYKAEFARKTGKRTLADAMKHADVFCGLSQAGLVTGDMVKSMNRDPIIFAMANPDPEITPDEVRQVRKDAITATGRSDFPNQVNNVLGFPFVFRGALDVRATRINEPMKVAAAQALAELARRGKVVPQIVRDAYGNENFELGPDYIIPKPFDPRILTYVVPAVAQAAMDSGVARKKLDIVEYGLELSKTSATLSGLNTL
jgi:malate dehydrogenase (oxaloacetate-decarboxylating)(NADP+)